MLRKPRQWNGLWSPLHLLCLCLFLQACASQNPAPPRSYPTTYSAPEPMAAPVQSSTQAGVTPMDDGAATVAYSPSRPTVPAPPTASSNVTSSHWPPQAPATVSASAIMVDARSGKVLYHKNADQRRGVASTQKLLTALLVAERGNLQQEITIQTSDTTPEPTKLGFKPGEKYARATLLTSIMVRSANDAAAALGRDHSGSITAFGRAMTARAQSLGAMDSNFLNPHGLTEPGQFSTARDMARVAMVAYRNPTLRRLMKLTSYNFTFNDGRVRHLTATNKLIARSPVYNGMKTGFTYASGRCLISSASSGGQEIILVQLGGTTRPVFDDAERLLQWQLSRDSFASR